MSDISYAPRFTPPPISEIDSLFPSHKVTGFIAQGGMGAVYLAEQISLERHVAIKILPRDFSGDSDYVASFHSEAKAMATVNHSNLVGIYDFGSVNGMLFIIMEYIPGRSLFEVANGQAVDELEAAHLILEISRGLAQAHKAGIIHRDIKPANILIDDKGSPKIVDFGLAKPHGDSHGDGVIFGTPGYTAPEVITNPNALDQKSDVYSIGAMLYELLTGQLASDPYRAPSLASGCDPRFDSIVARALQPDPANRTNTADELAKDLDDLIRSFEDQSQSAPTSQGPQLVTAASSPTITASPPRPVTPLKSAKGNGGIVLFLFLVIAAAGGYFYWDHAQKSITDHPDSVTKPLQETTPKPQSTLEVTPAHQFNFTEGANALKDSAGTAAILDGEGIHYRAGRAVFTQKAKRAPRVLLDKERLSNTENLALEFWINWKTPKDKTTEVPLFSLSSKQGKMKEANTARSISVYTNQQGALSLRAKLNRVENEEPIAVLHKNLQGKPVPFPESKTQHLVLNLDFSNQVCQVYLAGKLVMELPTEELNLTSLSEDGLIFLLGQGAHDSEPSFVGFFHQMNVHYQTLTQRDIRKHKGSALFKDN